VRLSACLAFALAVTMADSTSSTSTLRTAARGFRACLAGSRLVRPDSHLMYVGTDTCARAARVRALNPAEMRRRRKSAGPPASSRSAAPTFRASARRWSISGRGVELPSSQREIRSPPATLMRRANSCWVRPIRRRAARRATGSTPDSTRTNDTLGRPGPCRRRRPRPTNVDGATELLAAGGFELDLARCPHHAAEPGHCRASPGTRLSGINRRRTTTLTHALTHLVGEEFLCCVKAAGYADGGAAVGRACGLRPVPPCAALRLTWRSTRVRTLPMAAWGETHLSPGDARCTWSTRAGRSPRTVACCKHHSPSPDAGSALATKNRTGEQWTGRVVLANKRWGRGGGGRRCHLPYGPHALSSQLSALSSQLSALSSQDVQGYSPRSDHGEVGIWSATARV
jgi:hypothetical protein